MGSSWTAGDTFELAHTFAECQACVYASACACVCVKEEKKAENEENQKKSLCCCIFC